MASKSGKLMVVVREVVPILKELNFIAVDAIEEIMVANGFNGITIASVMRAVRVTTSVEYVACDDDFCPSTISHRPATQYVHPRGVQNKTEHQNWLQAIASAWLMKADRFTRQMS
jgi:hypothetical protein